MPSVPLLAPLAATVSVPVRRPARVRPQAEGAQASLFGAPAEKSAAARVLPAPPVSAAAPAAPAAAAERSSTPAPSSSPSLTVAPAVPAAPADEPEALHPALWRAHQLARPRAAVFASGFAVLDEALPGGGWPAGTLTELLLPHLGVGELRLLAPVLASLQARQQGLMWFGPPAAPCPWALRSLGLDAGQIVVVQPGAAWQAPPARPHRGPAPGSRAEARTRASQGRSEGRSGGAPGTADVLWALEQALRSGHLGAVLAWLPARLPSDALRRLQLAAQAHEGPVFLLRGDDTAVRASPAPLRIRLACAGPDALELHLVKRRGPPLAAPLVLPLPPVLSRVATARAQARRQAAARPALPQPAPSGHGAGAGVGNGRGNSAGHGTPAHARAGIA